MTDKLEMNFTEEWRYKESVLDVYNDLGLKLSDDEAMEYYHNFLRRIHVHKKEQE